MKLSKGWIILIVIIAIVVILVGWGSGVYNKMVTRDENVGKAWANVENVYQRRTDLIPNLVATVKGVADFEKSTLTDVIEARANATKVTVDPTNLNAQTMQQFQTAQDGLSSALSRLMVVVERYPELKATQNFMELQAQLEGTENRITVERMKFNEAAQAYNTYIKRFPGRIFAGMFGFEPKTYFEAQKGAETAPKVEF